jgi:uncharacterized protein (TIGR02996 family)
MRDDKGFLQAIAADPTNDGLRLIYADWLEDQGDPRCELVRVCQAMREAPVWSDRYWELKARRNELWRRCPLEWLEATGYDGSYYDPVFRDGVPDGWQERWRLIREFTERWHGVAVPNVGGRAAEVRQAEERLGLKLPPAVREVIAYVHDIGDYPTPAYDLPRAPSLFHCAHYQLNHLHHHPAISLIYYTLDCGVLGTRLADLARPDPPTWFYYEAYDHDGNYVPLPEPRPHRDPTSVAPRVTLSIFQNLLIELPTAGSMEILRADVGDLLARLHDDFPVHARFDDADIFEGNELLVLVGGPRSGLLDAPARRVEAILRRPVPLASVPGYLFGTNDWHTGSSGLLGPEPFRRRMEEELRRPGARQPRRWLSVLRREVGPPGTQGLSPPGEQQPLPQDVPGGEWGDDIPF